MSYRFGRCVAFGVPDIPSAVRFYERTMGFTKVKESAEWVEMDGGELRVFICNDDYQKPAFELLVDDVPAAVERLQREGCKLEKVVNDEPFMTDPFGYLFAVSKAGP